MAHTTHDYVTTTGERRTIKVPRNNGDRFWLTADDIAELEGLGYRISILHTEGKGESYCEVYFKMG